MKKLSTLITEKQENSLLIATHLIDSNGHVVEKRGRIDLNRGIYDENDQKYVGAISEDGKIYTSLSDFNTVVINIDNPNLPDATGNKGEMHPNNTFLNL